MFGLISGAANAAESSRFDRRIGPNGERGSVAKARGRNSHNDPTCMAVFHASCCRARASLRLNPLLNFDAVEAAMMLPIVVNGGDGADRIAMAKAIQIGSELDSDAVVQRGNDFDESGFGGDVNS